MKQVDGQVLKGEFLNLNPNGKIKVSYAKGTTFEGTISHDKKDGHGVTTYASRDVYENE